MIRSVRHTGIVVRDLEKSTEFYCALGFVKDNQAIEEGNFIDTVVGLQNTKLEWVKLKAPDGYLLELLQYHSHPESTEITQQKSNKLGCSHMAFSVDNIDRICEKIEQLGGFVINPPALTNDKKIKVAYCHDLEGVLMEIVEIL
jgi:catechol 2,3-dioxygenase-like lactoylglutathione lyase family enzyme